MVQHSRFAVVVIVAIGLLSAGCRQSKAARELATALDAALDGKPVSPGSAEVWNDVRA